VQRVYIEVAEPFEREIYLGFVLDRKVERVRIIASRFGGMEIEEIAKEHPEEILQVVVEPAVGLQPFEARELAFGLGLTLKQVSRAVTSILGCYRAFRDLDATMVEINPLVVTKDDRVLALDARCRSTTMRCSGGIPLPTCATTPKRIHARSRPPSIT